MRLAWPKSIVLLSKGPVVGKGFWNNLCNSGPPRSYWHPCRSRTPENRSQQRVAVQTQSSEALADDSSSNNPVDKSVVWASPSYHGHLATGFRSNHDTLCIFWCLVSLKSICSCGAVPVTSVVPMCSKSCSGYRSTYIVYMNAAYPGRSLVRVWSWSVAIQ